MKLSANLTKPLLCTLLGSACVYSINALADATIIFEQKDSQHSEQNIMLIKDGKVRFTSSSQGNSYSIFNSQSNKMVHINPQQKQYLEMDQKDIEEQARQAKQQMETMRKEMEKRMKDLPPEQRKQLEQMMGNHLDPKGAQKNQPEVKQEKTSQTETIVGIKCDVYESTVNGQKISESCFTAIDKLGLDKEDLDSLEKMQGFMKEMQQAVTDITGNVDTNSEIQGLPLHTKLFARDGTTAIETTLVSISKDAVAADKFTIPTGFTPVPMPNMPQ
jgi:flagellar biosynthesis GTPase FlhF